MKPPSHYATALRVQAASRNLLSRLLLRLQAWKKNLSWQSRYARAQHGQGSRLASRLAVDLALLGGVAFIPLAIFFWSHESEQQQLARLPSEPTRYVEGWQMAQTYSHVFFDTPAPVAQERADPPSAHGAARIWKIRCGQLYETLSSRRPPSEQQALAIPTRHLQCRGGAQVDIKNITLTTPRLAYEKRAQGYRLTTDRPVLVLEGKNRLSSLGGGIVEENNELRMFRDISFQAPNLQINAQGEFQGINFQGIDLSNKDFSKKNPSAEKKRRLLIFKRNVTFSFQTPSKRYHGTAQLAKLLPCAERSTIECRVFGSDALRRILLEESVVVSERGLDAETLWTLQAKRVIVQDELAHCYGGERGGKVRIVLADSTQLIGQRGTHNLSNNSGLLCGAVEVQSSEGVLTGACLRYNLTEQRYALESSASEQELVQRFLAR